MPKQLKAIAMTVVYVVASNFLVTTAWALAPFSVELEVTQYGLFDLSAQGQIELKQRANDWQATISADARFGRQNERSTFAVEDQAIRSIEYKALSRLTFLKEQKHYRFDGDAITGSVNNDSFTTANRNTLDPVTKMLNMSLQLQQGQQSWRQESISWSSSRAEEFAISRQGMMNTAVGRLAVTLVEQTSGNRRGESNYFWFADDYGYIPIRWRREVDGDLKFEARLLNGTYNNQTIGGE